MLVALGCCPGMLLFASLRGAFRYECGSCQAHCNSSGGEVSVIATLWHTGCIKSRLLDIHVVNYSAASSMAVAVKLELVLLRELKRVNLLMVCRI